jgi:hypothetical protein
MGTAMGTTLGTFDKENGMNLQNIWPRKWDKFKEHLWENIWELWEQHKVYVQHYCEDVREQNP